MLGFNDLQTEADRSAQRLIVNSLLKHFPKVTIIGEETLEKVDKDEEIQVNLDDCEIIGIKCPEYLAAVKEEDVVIWVDPLDGTAEYTQGINNLWKTMKVCIFYDEAIFVLA
ncbi:3'(2'),5'-bisphosphate nucleotidase 1-like isoform X2 [Uloborus diversus]|uniref:3'(2'),5'-bisphosphate nucleotidase 1-like isoform X2 n=1 Tax=Uloborus diversus TaxID=327109 RepID=UPI00240A3868|nr:3'(2'),5'-bisphosphate nucleotidase 1-like isoform X2 [Uloborus diversus]